MLQRICESLFIEEMNVYNKTKKKKKLKKISLYKKEIREKSDKK